MRAHLDPLAARPNCLSTPWHARRRAQEPARPLAAALALCAVVAAALAAPAAQASDGRVQWSVQIGLPVPVLPVPVPLPLRVETRPVQVHGPAYPAPIYPPPAWRDRDRDGVPDWRDGYDNRRPPPHSHHHRPGWRVDRDRDGVPDWRDGYDNRRDWRPLAPGWHHRWPDRGPDRGPDRDHDGRPDWRERPGR